MEMEESLVVFIRCRQLGRADADEAAGHTKCGLARPTLNL
jgi:hypothetical protein